MAEKKINGRIVLNHDIESNWILATGFTPLKGEVIIYDIDDNYNYERIKIGDGVTNVNSLPFVNDSVKEELLTKVGEVETKVDEVADLVGDTSVAEQITNALGDLDAITFEEIDEICGAEPFAYDEAGNVSVLSAFKDSAVSYDDDGNVVIN